MTLTPDQLKDIVDDLYFWIPSDSAGRDSLDALIDELKNLRGKILRVQDWGRDQARPFPDGVPDREGEGVWRDLQAVLADRPKP